MLKISAFVKLAPESPGLKFRSMASFNRFFKGSKEEPVEQQDVLNVAQETKNEQNLISADFDAVKKTEFGSKNTHKCIKTETLTL